MKLFDDLIAQTLALLEPCAPVRFPFAPERAAGEGEPNELILRRETAFELGEGSYPAVSFTAVTQDETLVREDGTCLCGPDLHEIKGDCAFARITLLRTDDIFKRGDQAAFALIKSMEVKKFEVWPWGYMMRPSALTNREQVRVSQKAVKDGLRFEHVGNLLIQKYRENPHVLAAAVLFVTLPSAPYRALDALADRAAALTGTLNHALADASMNCRACEWKSVCDVVDGMKELHQKQMNKGRNLP